jgi:hypothetical protein
MKEASIVKVISPCKEDIADIVKCLERSFAVAATSAVIYDKVKNKYHQFLSVS